MEIIVRYKSRGYKTSRNILHEGSKDIVYKRSYDLFKFPQHLAYRLIGSNLFLRNSHYSLLNSDNSIWHLFNGISWNTYPWITTFETSLPRWGNIPEWLYNKGIKQLAKNNCKKIIAMSCCAAQIQEAFLKEYSPAYKEVIVEKLEVLHPPQAPLIASYKEKNLNNIRIEFTLIGADFFRKGGTEILKVFDQLLKNDSPVKLNIISSLSYGDYASHTSVEDLERAKKII
ncbi:MAG TPA: hypothetical protein VE868_12115, partial [Balneolaceae bacterium]|nr:hypothetical protein [Balneolaceae bacterium]